MQTFIKNRIFVLLLVLAPFAMASCNKDDIKMERAMQVMVTGYNGSEHALQFSIDTTVFDVSVKNGDYIVKPASVLHFYAMYNYPQSRKNKTLVITDTVTKAVIFRQVLPESGSRAHFNFVYIDGKEVPSQPPAADPNTNKLGFFARNPGSNEPIDIFLYRTEENGNEHRAYLAKNVRPNSWTYVDYLAAENFTTKGMHDKAFICFTKAGTTDQWAFQNDETQSRIAASGLYLPLAGEKGLVQQYFFTPGTWALEVSRMFFVPDRAR